jgi:hypothetical protein
MLDLEEIKWVNSIASDKVGSGRNSKAVVKILGKVQNIVIDAMQYML